MRKRNAAGYPLRKIISRSVRLRRGRGTYTSEVLECCHSYEIVTSGAQRKAKQRGCYECFRKEQRANDA